MQCTNNLKQIMLAVQNYHDTNNSFQPARGGSGKSGNVAGCVGHLFWLLPFAEGSAIYDEWDSNNGPDPMVQGGANFKKAPNFMLCPSDSKSKLPCAWEGGAAQTNYCGSWGDTSCETDESCTESRGFFRGGRYANPEQASGSHTTTVVTRTLSDIVDGTSNTIAYSEMCCAEKVSSTKVRGGIARVSESACTNPRTYLNLLRPSDRNSFNILVCGICAYGRGQCFADGNVSITGFQTICPPNTPSGRVYPADSQHGWGKGICSAQSYHSGGVNCGMVDGSVRFISDTVDCGDMDAEVRDPNSKYWTETSWNGKEFTGNSPFGVWGALGTIEGGETTSSN